MSHSGRDGTATAAAGARSDGKGSAGYTENRASVVAAAARNLLLDAGCFFFNRSFLAVKCL